MKLGVFDSGLGGLIIASAIKNNMPKYDMIYLGDTLHVPYGSRSSKAILDYTWQGMKFLFEKDCQIIIMACNTASAAALRIIQQQYLTKHYPDRRILGVVVPTLEECADRGYKSVGVIGTNYIINSGVYAQELKKINNEISIDMQATPLLVPMIENNGMKWIRPVLEDYMQPLITNKVQACILGCTHYIYLKEMLSKIYGDNMDIISQDEIVPPKLADYLSRHAEIDDILSKNGMTEFYVTDKTSNFEDTAIELYKEPLDIKAVEI